MHSLRLGLWGKVYHLKKILLFSFLFSVFGAAERFSAVLRKKKHFSACSRFAPLLEVRAAFLTVSQAHTACSCPFFKMTMDGFVPR